MFSPFFISFGFTSSPLPNSTQRVEHASRTSVPVSSIVGKPRLKTCIRFCTKTLRFCDLVILVSDSHIWYGLSSEAPVCLCSRLITIFSLVLSSLTKCDVAFMHHRLTSCFILSITSGSETKTYAKRGGSIRMQLF